MHIGRVSGSDNETSGDCCSPAMRASIQQAIAGAFATQFGCDPLLDPALSRLISVCASSIKRHGALLEAAIAEALVAGGLIVLRNIRLPFTRGSLAIVASDDYSISRRHRLAFDPGDVAGNVDIDILAMDEKAGWFAAHQVRRGGGATDSGKRRRSEREMRAAELVLSSWLRHKGYASMSVGGVSVIDCLGQTGYPPDLVLEPADLDGYYGLPITAAIAGMTSFMKRELEFRVGSLVKPLFDSYDARTRATEDRNLALKPREQNCQQAAPLNVQETEPERAWERGADPLPNFRPTPRPQASMR